MWAEFEIGMKRTSKNPSEEKLQKFQQKKKQHTERIKTQLQTLVCRREAARTRGDEEKKIKLSIIWLWYELREWEKLQIVSELSHARRPSSYTPLWFLSLSPHHPSYPLLIIQSWRALCGAKWSDRMVLLSLCTLKCRDWEEKLKP